MIGHFQSIWVVKICKSVSDFIMTKTKYTVYYTVLATILDVYAGNDAIMRTNKNKTPTGEITR